MDKRSKILFCHIPKCSGTNINAHLVYNKPENYVYYIHNILKYDIKKYESYYKFAIIRDPIEKIVSVYFYQTSVINRLKAENSLSHYQEGNWKRIDNLYKKYNITDVYSFLNSYKTFYNNEIKPEILELKKHNETKNMRNFYIVCFLPQYLFICDDNYNLLVDDIVNINDCDKFMYNKFGITLNNQKLNTHINSNDKYYNYLTQQNINDIKEIYKEDYAYLFDNKILFCHIPKCAGTTINAHLVNNTDTNYVYYVHRILKYDINKYVGYYKFAIIRDPIEKIVSVYFYQTSVINRLKAENSLSHYQEGNWKRIDNLYKKYNITDVYSFLNSYKTFYNNEIKPEILELKKHNETKNMRNFYIVCFLPQYLFICDDNYNLLVDDIVNINDCDKFMYNKFGITLNNQKLNTHINSNDKYYNYVTQQNINDITEIYKEDYEYLFNNTIN